MSLYYLINIVKIEVLIFNFISKNAQCPFNTYLYQGHFNQNLTGTREKFEKINLHFILKACTVCTKLASEEHRNRDFNPQAHLTILLPYLSQPQLTICQGCCLIQHKFLTQLSTFTVFKDIYFYMCSCCLFFVNSKQQ